MTLILPVAVLKAKRSSKASASGPVSEYVRVSLSGSAAAMVAMTVLAAVPLYTVLTVDG